MIKTTKNTTKNTDKEEKYYLGGRPSKKLYRLHDTLLVYGQFCASIVSSTAIMMGTAYWFLGNDAEEYKTLAVVNGLLVYIFYTLLGVYHQSDGNLFGRIRKFFFGLWIITKAWVWVVLSSVFFVLITKPTNELLSSVIIIWALLGLLVQAGIYILTFFISRYFVHFTKPIPTLVIGANPIGEQLVNSLNNNTWLPDKVLGVIDNDVEARSSWTGSAPILGDTNYLKKLIKQYSIRRIYISLRLNQSIEVGDIIKQINDQCLDIIWVPDIFAFPMINHGIRELSGLPLLVLSGSPMKNIKAILIKSILDKIIAFNTLVVLSPLLITVALAVKVTSHGPIFFKQKRHGWDGSVIEIWKFRSMYVTKNNHGKLELAQRNDPRITRVGKFIRHTSMDELPQLFNVLQGTMSLVGPRPHAIEVNHFYSKHIPNFMHRHRIKPGITGLAQICGCRGGDDCTTKTLDRMQMRASLDIKYINNWTLLLDLKILIITPFKLFSQDVY